MEEEESLNLVCADEEAGDGTQRLRRAGVSDEASGGEDRHTLGGAAVEGNVEGLRGSADSDLPKVHLIMSARVCPRRSAILSLRRRGRLTPARQRDGTIGRRPFLQSG